MKLLFLLFFPITVFCASFVELPLKEKLKHKDLIFAVTFDDWTVNANKAVGNPFSTTMKNVGLKLRGEVGFDGQQAFRPVPGEDLKFSAVGNASPHEGTLSLWANAVDYMPKDTSRGRGNTSLATLYFRQGKDYIRFLLYVFKDEINFEWWSSAPPSNFRGIGRVSGSLAKIKKNEWFQVVATWKKDQLALYLNGELSGEARLKAKYIQTANLKPDSNSFIGVKSRFYDDKHKWATAIDDYLIYSRALTPMEIRKMYQSLRKDTGSQGIRDYEVSMHGVVTDKPSKLDQIEVELDLSGLPDKKANELKRGKLKMYYRFISPDGKKQQGCWICSAPNEKRMISGVSGVGECVLETSPDQKKYQKITLKRPDLRFAYNSLGIGKDVPAVFKGFKATSRNIALWNRQYQFGGGPLPEQITVANKKLLRQAPVVVIDGKTPVWKKEKDTFTKRQAVLTGTGICGKVKLGYKTTIDYDGMIRFDWTILNRSEIKNMDLVWQVEPEFSEYLMTPRLEQSKAETFAYKFPLSGQGTTLLWLAAEKKGGFAFSMPHDGNWVYDAAKPVFFVNRKQGSCKVILINSSKTVDVPANTPYVALFIATPTRPFTKQLRVRRYMDLSKTCYPRFAFTANAGLDGIFTFKPHPTDFAIRTQNFPPKAFVCYGAADSLTTASDLSAYFKKYANVPGVSVYRMMAYEVTKTPRKYTKQYYYSVPFCGRTGIIYDYYLWNQKQMFEHPLGDRVGVINYDLFENHPCRNPLHGCGFKDKFGRDIQTFQLLHKRQLAMRTMEFAHANHRELDLHAQNNFSPFIHGFCDYWNVGEQIDVICNRNLYGYCDEVPEAVYRSEFNRDLLGVQVDALPQLAQAGRRQMYKEIPCNESMLAEFLVHDIDFEASWMNTSLATKIWNIFEKYGIQDQKTQCIRFYEKGNPVKNLTPGIRVTYYKTPKAILLIVANKDKETKTAQIDLSVLKLKDGMVREEYRGEDLPLKEGKFSVTISGRSFRIIGYPKTSLYPLKDGFERPWEITIPKGADTQFHQDWNIYGNAAPSLVLKRGASQKHGYWCNTFPVEHGKTCSISIRCRQDKGEFALMRVVPIDKKKRELKVPSLIIRNRFKPGWREMNGKITIGKDGLWKECNAIQVILITAGKNSTARFDDFQIDYKETF